MDYEKYYQKAQNLKSGDFKQIIGVKKETFAKMESVLKEEYQRKHAQGGRNPKMPVGVQLMLTLKYLRQYVTQKELAFDFEVGEATVHDTIEWVENTLVKDSNFKLPGKKVLLEDESIEVILVDVMECPIERPKKNRKGTIPAKRRNTP